VVLQVKNYVLWLNCSDSQGNTIYLPGTEIPAQYFLPAGAIAGIKDGGEVGSGDVWQGFHKNPVKPENITGGLPRVAIYSKRVKQKTPQFLLKPVAPFHLVKKPRQANVSLLLMQLCDLIETLIPKWRHITVFEGGYVRKKGETLLEGELTPHIFSD